MPESKLGTVRIVVFSLFASVGMLAVCLPLAGQQVEKGLPAELKAKVDKLVDQLGYKKYRVREAATEELKNSLERDEENSDAILLYLKQHLAKSKDPEVKTRLERLISGTNRIVILKVKRLGKNDVTTGEYPVEQILQYVTELTGYDVVIAPNIAGRRIKVLEDMKANAKMLESMLKLNGITLHLKSEDGRTSYHAITDRELRTLRYEPGELYSENDKLPRQNVLVTVPVTVKHLDPTQVERTLTNRIVNRQGPGSVVSMSGSNVVLLKDFAPKVVSYMKIIREMDKPVSVKTSVVQVRQADPGDLVVMLRSLAYSLRGRLSFLPDTDNARIVLVGNDKAVDTFAGLIEELDKPIPVEVRTIQLKYALPGDVVESLKTGKDLPAGLEVFADSKSGRVVVVGSSAVLNSYEKVIRALDKEASERAPVFKIYKLKHANASNVAAMLNEVFNKEEKARGFVAAVVGGTSSVVVRADDVMHEQVRELIESADAPTEK